MPLPWRLQVLGFASLGCVGFFFLSEIGKQARPDEIEAYAQYTYWVIAALVALILFSLYAAWQSKRNGLQSIVGFASGFFLCAIIAGTSHETLGRAVSGIDLANRVRANIPIDANFYSVCLLDHTMPFYLGRTMIMVEEPDELQLGVNQQPEPMVTYAGCLHCSMERRSICVRHDGSRAISSTSGTKSPYARDRS